MDANFCILCGERHAVNGELCDVCKGFEAPNKNKIEDEECQDCGEWFEPWIMGLHLQRKLCRECMTKKRIATRRANSRKNPTKDAKTLPLVKKTGKFDLVAAIKKHMPDRVVVLDFSNYSWVLAWLNETLDPDFLAEELLREQAEKVPAEWLKKYLLGEL